MSAANTRIAPKVAQSGAALGLSIVVPLYNEAAALERLHARLVEVALRLKQERSLACELIYVDDGSRDGTLAIARDLRPTGLDVQVLSLSRNFGKEAALLAGLEHARRGAMLFIDGDGQHPPDMIETLVGHWLDEDCDVVYTAKASRAGESFVRRLSVKSFYTLINWGAKPKIPEDAGDFRLLSPRAANALRQLPERNRFFKGLSSWIGFRQMRIDYEPAPRVDGRSTWNMRAPDRAFDRRRHRLLGGAAAACHRARHGARGDRLHVRSARSSTRPWSMAPKCPAIRHYSSASWCSAACSSS